MSKADLEKRVRELEQRVADLERRPVHYPVVQPVFVPLPQPPYYPPWTITSGDKT